MANPEILRQLIQEPHKTAQARSFQNTLDFLADATPTFRYLQTPWPPRHNNLTETIWQRNYNIAGRYFGTDATLSKIAKDENLTRERIRQIAKAVVKALYRNSNLAVQYLHRPERFDFDKSYTLEGRQKKSQQRGGRSFQIAELVSQGMSSPEIKDTLGLNSASLCNARRILKDWGINMPTEKELNLEKSEKLKDPDLSDAEAQKILDTITKSNYSNCSRGEEPVLIPVSRVARGADLLFTSRDIKFLYSILRNSGIPASSVPLQKSNKNLPMQTIPRYYFIRSLDIDRAITALKQSSI